jgi:hypothetical protein
VDTVRRLAASLALFDVKKPRMDAGTVEKNGDNIYEPSEQHDQGFRQLQSMHSEPEPFGKSENTETKKSDLKGEHVLISTNFAYFGSKPVDLPPEPNAPKVGI